MEENKPKKKKIIWDILIVIGVLAVGFAIYKFVSLQMNYAASNSLYANLTDQYVNNKGNATQKNERANNTFSSQTRVLVAEDYNYYDELDSSQVTTGAEKNAKEVYTSDGVLDWYELVSVDIKGLQDYVNPDVRGWIYFENEDQDISYPVVYSATRDYYLRRSIDGAEAVAGTIYIDDRNKDDWSDGRTILYGHNMRDLSMFGKLKYYKQYGYYEDHQYFQIVTAEGIERYRIFACYDIREDQVDRVLVYKAKNKSFKSWLEEIQELSWLKSDIEVSTKDKFITLVTCNNDKRFIIEAVMVDQY